MAKLLWIGLVGVISNGEDHALEVHKGAYVNVIALAYSQSDFTEQVHSAADKLGLSVMEIEDVDEFEKRIARHHVDEELHELAAYVEESGEVAFGTFHAYDRDTDVN